MSDQGGPPPQPSGQQQSGWEPPPAPKKQRSGAFKAGFLGCFGVLAAVVVVIVVVAVVASSGSKTTSNVPAGADEGQSTTSAAAQGAPAGTVLLSVTGSGTKTTKRFSTAGDWDLAWAYDCSSFGMQGNFIVSVSADDPLSAAAMLAGVNQLGDKDSGVEHFHSGGKGIWLEVNSECSWSVKAVAA